MSLEIAKKYSHKLKSDKKIFIFDILSDLKKQKFIFQFLMMQISLIFGDFSKKNITIYAILQQNLLITKNNIKKFYHGRFLRKTNFLKENLPISYHFDSKNRFLDEQRIIREK